MKFSIISLGLLLAIVYPIQASSNNTDYPDKLTKLGSYIEQSIENSNPSYLNSLFDYSLIVNKISCNLPKSDFSEIYNKGFIEGLQTNFNLGSALCSQIQEGGSFKLISIGGNSSYYQLTYRLFSSAGLNYYRFDIVEAQGEFKIADVFVYLTGETLSEMFASVYYANLDGSELPINCQKKLAQQIDVTSKKEKLLKLTYSGKADKALKYFNSLESQLKNNKQLLVTAIFIASKSDLAIYHELIQHYETTFDNDIAYCLNSIEGLSNLAAVDEASSCIAKLKQKLEDPMLDYFKGLVLQSNGYKVEASLCWSTLIRNLPDFEIAYFSLLESYLDGGSFEDATELLQKMTANFNYYKEDFTDMLASYPSFINSKEYTTWLEQ